MSDTGDPSDVLGPDGLLAGEIEGWEHRPQQLEMARLVGAALEKREHAVIEAPTGVGKSFAYLVPLARAARASGRKVVVSTATIALQEQLVGKDLPLLQKVVPGLTVALVKGRANYLSRRRLAHAWNGQSAWLETGEDKAELRLLHEWAATNQHGDRTDLGFEPRGRVWAKVVSDPGNCLGRKCPTYEQCFFYRARRQIEDAEILVVNHHLYFSDLALRDEHGAILPPHDVVVFDEAHAIEDIATDHLGVNLTEAQIVRLCDDLYSARGRGLLADTPFQTAREAVGRVRAANTTFWNEVVSSLPQNGEEATRLLVPDRFADPVSPALVGLAEALRAGVEVAEDLNQSQELKAQADRAVALAGGLRQIVGQELEGFVYYATVPANDRRGTPGLSANPLAVAPLLKERLFDRMASVILTSATLAADDSERFLFLRRRIGIEGGTARRLDSPFDYQRQARLLVNEAPLEPNSPRFEQALGQWIGDFLDTATGGTFVLFTSYRQLEAVHSLLAPRLERARRFVLRQGDRISRTQMLDLFKAAGDAVLFGTASFWEGVDVRGEALTNVIITKLPFEMPNHPLVEARHGEIRARGGNPFMERTVPEAILRLKQGVGRLIRTASDRGVVVICDHRVLTKAYGRYFLRALPPMPLERFRLDDGRP